MLRQKSPRVRKPVSNRRLLKLESLENRQMLAGDLDITPNAQLLIELINRARENPAAEAARYGIGLNDDVPAASTISNASKQPLAPHQALVDAAVAHSLDMLDRDFFAHNTPAPNSTSPSDRAMAAGYPAGAGENIGWGGSTGSIDQVDHVYARHESLFKSVGHRINMLYPQYRELGTAVEYGVFTAYNSQLQRYVDYNSSMATEMFGSRGGDQFITGVAYDDSVDDNDFYNIGEGQGGLLVRAVNTVGTVFETTTGDAGGYSLQVPDGTYTVRFVQPNGLQYVDFSDVVISDQNVKVDLDDNDVTWLTSVSATAVSTLDATTFGNSDTIQTSGVNGIHIGDDFIPVDSSTSYTLQGRVRSGNDSGGQYTVNNRQYFGFASYDSDQLLIGATHVMKFGDAVDTRLASPLRPGDAQIVLHDTTGWANSGAAHQRAFSWFGYTNSDGYEYPEYTYTRNVAQDLSNGMWDTGGISGNTITLREPWDGPQIDAGTAIRNATSGLSFNYSVLNAQAVANQWTNYSAALSGVGLGSTQFRPGTASIKPLILSNYHGITGNLVHWQDVSVRHTGTARYEANSVIDLNASIANLGSETATYQWSQLSGPSVQLTNASTARASVLLPSQETDYQIVLQVTSVVGGTTISDTLSVDVNGSASFNAVALLDATTFVNGYESLAVNGANRIYYADELIAVDPTEQYQLRGQARSGNNQGGQYTAANLQYFGFASFDSDEQIISPWHVSKYGPSTDTALAQTLRPGDTQIVLQDARGWANAGAAHQRSIVWYDYRNGDGYVYPDYTYTRNVALDFSNGIWDAGGITGNTITLRKPWNGPQIAAGSAVRNATSGASFNYAVVNGQAVPNHWTNYQAILTGTGLGSQQFRPGTAYIKPVALTNYQGDTGNLIRWQYVEVRYKQVSHAYQSGQTIDVVLDDNDMAAAAYQWTQLSGPTAQLSDTSQAGIAVVLPTSTSDYQITLQVDKTVGGVTVSDVLTISAQGVATFRGTPLLNATTFLNGNESLAVNGANGTFRGDDLVAINPTESYVLSGQARSGNDAGGQYVGSNRQYFGFASYDADQRLISPWQVLKYGSATDTTLAATLRPGDTQLVLQNAAGWANAGSAHQRALAWYGYQNDDGYTYADYTYTRNVAIDFVSGLWDAGGISGNTITLREPWSGPQIDAGSAVRNATSGSTYSYALVNGLAIPQQWTDYSVTLGGVGLGMTQFRPGTAFIKPIALTNYHGDTGNLVRWQQVAIRYANSQHAFRAGSTIGLDIEVDGDGTPPAVYQWRQLAGPTVQFSQPSQARTQLSLPASVSDYRIVLEIVQTTANGSLSETVTLDVLA